MKTKFLFSALFTFVFFPLSSQVPQGFNYQAIARDGSGNPITGAADFMKMNKINYFLGHESGLKTVVSGDNGKYNSFLGYQTGHENIVGKKNVFLGYKSGYKNNASYNVFVGNETGLNNVLGNLNVFVGHQAGMSNIGGQRNLLD